MGGTDNSWQGGLNMSIVDSPSTASEVTYKIQARKNEAVSISFEGTNGQSSFTLIEIGA